MIIKAIAFASLFVSIPVLACEGHEDAQNAQNVINDLTPEQLAKKLDAQKKGKASVALFDANGESTRKDKGIIPTAVLLPSSSEYDLALLPKDKAKEVVFYCAAERCSASTTAAKRALEAGHTKVSVLPSGIAGWLKAGLAVEKPVAAKTAAPAKSEPVETKPLQG